jgi:hypothetical protein
MKVFSSAVVVRGLENIVELELFRNDGMNVMNFGNDIQKGKGRVVGEEIGKGLSQ